MIEYISLKNFLSFKNETRFDFNASMEKPKKGYEFMKWYNTVNRKKLLKIQFLFGNNATGKTNLLTALSFVRKIICDQKKSKTDDESQIPDAFFKLSSETIDKPSEIEIAFHTSGAKYIYHVEICDNTILCESLMKSIGTKQPIEIFFRTHDCNRDIAVIRFDSKLFNEATQEVIRQSVIKNTSVLSIYDEKNFESTDFKIVYTYFLNSSIFYHFEEIPLSAMIDGRKNKSALRNVLLPLLKDLGSNIIDYEVNVVKEKITENEAKLIINIMGEEKFKEQFPNGERKIRTLRFAHTANTPSKLGWLSDSEESYGTLNMIRLIILLYDACLNHSPIAVDECSVGIHQQTFGRIIQFFLSTFTDMQIFFASQQISLMDMDGFRRDTVIFFDKNRDTGVTSCKKIDQKKYHKNISIVNAYINNSFGCLPVFPTQEEWIKQLDNYKKIIIPEVEDNKS